jgi:PAS domain S-box-containing protein
VEDRRRAEHGTDAVSYLRELPSLVLLDRLPIPMISVSSAGNIGYANPACAQMLGYAETEMLTRIPLPELLSGHSLDTPEACMDVLRRGPSAVHLRHAQGYVLLAHVSKPLLMRSTDVELLISLTDMTEQHWENPHAM